MLRPVSNIKRLHLTDVLSGFVTCKCIIFDEKMTVVDAK
jgi:hypothetical protein